MESDFTKNYTNIFHQKYFTIIFSTDIFGMGKPQHDITKCGSWRIEKTSIESYKLLMTNKKHNS